MEADIHGSVHVYYRREPGSAQISWIREYEKRLGKLAAQFQMIWINHYGRRGDNVLCPDRRIFEYSIRNLSFFL